MVTMQHTHSWYARWSRRLSTAAIRGFTLVELMITLAVLAILLAIAVPSFGRLLAANRLTTQANEFLSTLNLARSEAVRRGQPVTLLSKDVTIFSSGWTMFPDFNGNGAPLSTPTEADGGILRDSAAWSGTTTLTRVTCNATYVCATASASVTDRAYITFNSRGAKYAGEAALFRVCDSAYPALPGRIIQVSVIGKASVVSNTATCS